MTDPIADPLPGSAMTPKHVKLREAAVALEANFLAEMLKSAGFGEPVEGFGGGTGEEQFSSMLVQAQAQAMAENGGIGLAESLFQSLVENEDAE
ncbi:rod-binding protein [Mesobacterium pallidum]|uniref:rod-binding protein n=1 Tax=Mesobacterium pallidum TaxID=2872037 RepID=UPI001EE2EA94|nr:rod-binding protein [Mesobacterium pallidum]